MKKAEISNLRCNIMGTVSFDMQLEKWKKAQDFIVYPKGKNDVDKKIIIQSSKRYGMIDLETGEGNMTINHPSGAYSTHYIMDRALKRLEPFKLNDLDTQALRLKIFTTTGSSVGNRYVVSDNSGAVNVL